ncbi:MAG: hypothetical protein ACOYXA_01030 [Bacteroidota bacterium]
MIYLRFLGVVFRLCQEAFWHHPRMVRFLQREVQRACGDTVFPETVWRRIGLNVMVAQLVQVFVALLHGQPLSSSDRKKSAFLGAVTPLVDDLTDHRQLSTAQILDYLTVPGATDRAQRALQYLYRQLFPGSAVFRAAFLSALQAQEASLSQLGASRLAHEALQAITREKGARAFVWLRHGLRTPLVAGEAEACETLGFVLQLVNDLFDLYKDREAGQQTLLTNATDLRPFEALFRQEVARLAMQYRQLPLPAVAKARSWAFIVPILGVSEVCLQQLLRLQGEATSFDAQRHSRQQLVCDLAKWPNRVAAMRHSVALLRAWQREIIPPKA